MPELCNKTADGLATLKVEKELLHLAGPLPIIGRSVVIHADPDDFGKGGTATSLTTGNSGDRIACAVIGVVSAPNNVEPEHCSHY